MRPNSVSVESDLLRELVLTDAVRPGPNAKFLLREGFRMDLHRGEELAVPVLAAAVSRDRLLETFFDLLSLLGPLVDVVMESSHEPRRGGHRDLHRQEMDRPILESYLLDHEDLLLNDGCTGVAVIDRDNEVEIQLDEHKVSTIYAYNLEPFVRVLQANGVRRNDRLRLIMESEHVHVSHLRFAEEFVQFSYQLGVGEPLPV